MNFKQYYLIKESPDSAFFKLDKSLYGLYSGQFSGQQLLELEFSDGFSFTFFTMDGVLFYSRTNKYYHNRLVNTLVDFFHDLYQKDKDLNEQLNKLEINAIYTKPVKEDYADTFSEKIKKCFKKVATDFVFSRNDFLSNYQDEMLGRAWVYLGLNGVLLVSFWNSEQKFSQHNIKLLEKMSEKLKCAKDKITVETRYSSEYSPLLSMMQTSKTPTPPEKLTKNDLEILHLLSSKEKKEKLLAMGAKPKTPLDLMSKMKRMGD